MGVQVGGGGPVGIEKTALLGFSDVKIKGGTRLTCVSYLNEVVVSNRR